MVAVLMMSEILATLGPLKMKVFWNKGYDVIIFTYDVTDKILSRDSYYIIDVVMWQKFGNSSISMREVYHNLNFIRIWPEKPLAGCSWFKFNNLGLALGIALKFYVSVTKGLKLKVFRASSYDCGSYRGKTGRGPFWLPHPE